MILLKFRRIELGLSQRLLAQRSGLAQPLISNIESGRLRPTDDECLVLARVLGCDPAHLTRPVSAAPLGDGAESRMAEIDRAERRL